MLCVVPGFFLLLIHVWLSFEKHISSDDWFEFMNNLNYSFLFGVFFSSLYCVDSFVLRLQRIVTRQWDELNLAKYTLHTRSHGQTEQEKKERMHKLISCFFFEWNKELLRTHLIIDLRRIDAPHSHQYIIRFGRFCNNFSKKRCSIECNLPGAAVAANKIIFALLWEINYNS